MCTYMEISGNLQSYDIEYSMLHKACQPYFTRRYSSQEVGLGNDTIIETFTETLTRADVFLCLVSRTYARILIMQRVGPDDEASIYHQVLYDYNPRNVLAWYVQEIAQIYLGTFVTYTMSEKFTGSGSLIVTLREPIFKYDKKQDRNI